MYTLKGSKTGVIADVEHVSIDGNRMDKEDQFIGGAIMGSIPFDKIVYGALCAAAGWIHGVDAKETWTLIDSGGNKWEGDGWLVVHTIRSDFENKRILDIEVSPETEFTFTAA